MSNLQSQKSSKSKNISLESKILCTIGICSAVWCFYRWSKNLPILPSAIKVQSNLSENDEIIKKMLTMLSTNDKENEFKLAVEKNAEFSYEKYKDVKIPDTNWNIYTKAYKLGEGDNIKKYDAPNQTYWNVFSLLEYILSHCEKHKIPVFAEHGTLLGLIRNNHVIPWDWDGDLGIMWEYRDRFFESLKIDPLPKHVVMNHEMYKNDTGCLCFHFENYDDDLVDITFYKGKFIYSDVAIHDIFRVVTDEDDPVAAKLIAEHEDIIETYMTPEICALYPCKCNYTVHKKDLLPFKKTVWLGHNIYIPNNPAKMMSICYSKNWKTPPPEYNDYIIDKYITVSPFIKIQEYDNITFKELTKLIDTHKVPFIIRKSDFLKYSSEEYEKFINLQTDSPIYGYQSGQSVNLKAKDIWKLWKEHKLFMNVVDSPCSNKSNMLSLEWKEYIDNKLKNKHFREFELCWILTNGYNVASFHIDSEYAGGFMKLLSGDKIWWCILPEDLNYLFKLGWTIEKFAKLTVQQMLNIENNYLWGKFYVNRLTDNDFIWFPVNTLHKVITIEPSYGFGGYL